MGRLNPIGEIKLLSTSRDRETFRSLYGRLTGKAGYFPRNDPKDIDRKMENAIEGRREYIMEIEDKVRKG